MSGRGAAASRLNSIIDQAAVFISYYDNKKQSKINDQLIPAADFPDLGIGTDRAGVIRSRDFIGAYLIEKAGDVLEYIKAIGDYSFAADSVKGISFRSVY